MIDLKVLKSLIKLMVDNSLTELDVEHEGTKVRLARGTGGPVVTYQPAVHPMVAANAPAAAAVAAPAPAADEAQGLVTITSPMVGTFYAAPNPDSEPFVSAGDTVEAETVVCIIEAMKVFNEVKAEVAGSIAKVLVENGQAVEFGQPLFMVKPA